MIHPRCITKPVYIIRYTVIHNVMPYIGLCICVLTSTIIITTTTTIIIIIIIILFSVLRQVHSLFQSK